ncbi:ribonucleotide reductase large subunit [Bacillus phage Shbh1]|uniref:Ribonucleoside-diphosphate reductase n=1 Tax=Bacillus phage Shbh1 TaxID=1796992 RepID=A0A142F1H7_9CAUD|nr:ribonucleotide reductase large subunit [Bacillus phage Shbh1]AMQ66634.1 ribonucleoside-diphosphate reductase alpha subunit-like protein [Bacillus phage Shbh1]
MSKQIVNRGNTIEFYDPKKVEKYLYRYLPEDYDPETMKNYFNKVEEIVEKINEYVELEEEVTSVKIQEELYSIIEGMISVQESYWQNVAGCIKADILRKEVFSNRGFEKDLARMLYLAHENNQYTSFFTKYSETELEELGNHINYENDCFVNHIGVHIAYDRYTTSIPYKTKVDGIEVIKGTKRIETLQERYMTIAAFLLQDEKKDRISKVKEAYDLMSTKCFTPATPTFMNAGRPVGNLSSCFIGMAEDSLEGIYREAKQFANISKNAGGYGSYWGKVRSIGASIRNNPGMSSGSVPFMKLMDVTAGAVDQLGARAGAVTITLDAWHRDVSEFLKVPLSNTVLEKQMHKIFLAVSIPDVFFRRLQEKKSWYQFDPKEVSDVMGFCLEDSYDETLEGGTFTERYEQCIKAYEDGKLQLVNETSPFALLSQINKTRQEKGHPFLFFRDTVNRDNPNSGMIYSSNLCMEIAISMSPTTIEQHTEEINGETVIRETIKPGEIPTCNLSSLNLSKVAKIRNEGGDWKKYLADVISMQYRLLAKVVELNDHSEMPQTKISSLKKREVGLGVMGLAHALAISKMAIDSEEAIKWQEEVSEEIAYHTIKASMEYAKETGDIAPAFDTSKWADGSYIREKFMKHAAEENKKRWEHLSIEVMNHGMYSTVLMATAPTETISYIANTTAGTDPIMNKEYTVQKKGITANMVAPDINVQNFFYYKDGFIIKKDMFLRGVGARQKFIDQSISTNLYYIKDSLRPIDMVQNFLDAWKNGVKTLYYHRSESQQAYEVACESCSG